MSSSPQPLRSGTFSAMSSNTKTNTPPSGAPPSSVSSFGVATRSLTMDAVTAEQQKPQQRQQGAFPRASSLQAGSPMRPVINGARTSAGAAGAAGAGGAGGAGAGK